MPTIGKHRSWRPILIGAGIGACLAVLLSVPLWHGKPFALLAELIGLEAGALALIGVATGWLLAYRLRHSERGRRMAVTVLGLAIAVLVWFCIWWSWLWTNWDKLT